MKKIFLLLSLFFVLSSGTCERDDIPQEEQCDCIIDGTKQISFNNGTTWIYSGKDERSGMLFPCFYNGMVTNEYTDSDGVKTRIYWECKK